MRILVTGAAGFMGSHLAEELVRLGHDVASVDDLSGGYRENVCEGSKFLKLDLRDAAETERVVSDLAPEILCHLAANAREGASQFQPRDACSRNLTAYVNVLVPALRGGLKKVVLYSSMAVYGDQEPPFEESMPRRPVDVYGLNKASMEQITEILAEVHGFSYSILRPHNVFGERQDLCDQFRNVVAIFMNRIIRGEPLYVYGDGEQTRAFSYIGDSLRAFTHAVEMEPLYDRQAINVGGKQVVTVNELVSLVSSHFSVKPDIVYLPDRPLEVKHAYSTWQKSEQLLGYEEKFGLEEGICRMADWAKKAGPRPWRREELELLNGKTPRTWL